MNAPAPLVLAFVGRPGQGTSSAVAALVQAETGIGAAPFTTAAPRRWPLPADGTPLLEVVDLPGMEDAARALHWMGAALATPEARRARALDLLAAHAGAEFAAERSALEAVAAGACPVHVVDGSRPFRPNHLADADLLAWAGPPGVLLVVRAGGSEDHCAAWLAALADRYPSRLALDLTVPGPAGRAALLEAVALARPAWRPALAEVERALGRRRSALRSQAATIVARLLVDQLTHAEELSVDRDEPLEPRRAELEERFHRHLSRREAEARAAVEQLYGFAPGTVEAGALAAPVWLRDLFAEDTWTTLGLSPRQQVVAAAMAGAATGLAADAATGGASLGAGAAIGAAVGAGAAAWNLSRRRLRAHEAGPVASMRRALDALFTSSRTTRLVIGPHDGASFPWVLLERAALHHAAVAARSHARRGADVVAAAAPEPERRDDATVERLERVFARIRRHPEAPGTSVAELAREVERVLARRAPLPGDGERGD
ncbi:MAG: DUF3482 domain-containing protein [Anaeromyxobacter sp.]